MDRVEKKRKLNKRLKDMIESRGTNLLKYYKPYDKQKDFHRLGATYAERCFMAGNQLGKTLAGAAEAACHATGLYPDDWEGKRFGSANKGWACGETGEAVRDSIQLLLMGDIADDDGLGKGYLPKDKIISITRARGVADLLDNVKIKHINGGVSTIFFKSYSKGRTKFQASTINWIWFDEEPPPAIYSEGKTRTNVSGVFSFMTYTPLLGMSDISHQFYREPKPSQVLINMTIYDVDHYTDEEREAVIASYPDHERDARSKGIPILGSGRIFQVAEEKIQEPHILSIPKEWARINGLDFGWDHPQACVSAAWDRDSDVIHIVRAFKERECLPVLAASTIKPWGEWIPTAWPHDGFQHDKGSGLQLAEQYRDAGMEMLPKHATHEKGGFGVEAGITEMIERMRTGRFKVDETLSEWFEEYRMYHRKDGLIVKTRDDLMAASRYLVMMKRFAVTQIEAEVEDEDMEFDSLWA